MRAAPFRAPVMLFVLHLVALVAGCDAGEETKTTVFQSSAPAHRDTAPAVREEPVVSVFVMSGFTAAAEPRKTIFEAYDDGRVVWSENTVHGGGTLNEKKTCRRK